MIQAIRNWFSSFKKVFDVSGYQNLSLASMAQKSMFTMFDQNSPLLHSLPPWHKSLLEKIRASAVGGLATCLHRAVLLKETGPRASMYAPNGDKFSCIIPWDFNR